MSRNMGILDRIARIAVAVIIVALYMIGEITGTLAIVLLVIAGVFLLTSMVGTCPLYSVLGIQTCATRRSGS